MFYDRYSRIDTIPACDRETDRQKDRQTDRQRTHDGKDAERRADKNATITAGLLSVLFNFPHFRANTSVLAAFLKENIWG